MSQIGITRIKKTTNNPMHMWMNAIGQGLNGFARAYTGQQALGQQNKFNQQYMDMINRMYPQAGGTGMGAGLGVQQQQPFQPAQVPDDGSGLDAQSLLGALGTFGSWRF